MTEQQTGGQVSGPSQGTGAGTPGAQGNVAPGARPQGGASQRDASQRDASQRDASQGGEPMADRQRQMQVSREGGGAGMQRGSARTQAGSPLAGRGQSQASVLPALMANPWVMTNAFLANPFGFAQAMSEEMDRLFGQAGVGGQAAGRGLAASGGQQVGRGAPSSWAPPLEVHQRGNELVVSADLPGLSPEDVEIEVADGVLTISGERQQRSQDRQEGFFRSERSYGAFTRSIPLPDGVDEDQVRARFEHGVLEVTVPLPQQRPRGRRVQIQAGGTQNVGAPNAGAPNAGASSAGASPDRPQGQPPSQSAQSAHG